MEQISSWHPRGSRQPFRRVGPMAWSIQASDIPEGNVSDCSTLIAHQNPSSGAIYGTRVDLVRDVGTGAVFRVIHTA